MGAESLGSGFRKHRGLLIASHARAHRLVFTRPHWHNPEMANSGRQVYPTIPHSLPRLPQAEMEARLRSFQESMARRRSVRDFSPEPISPDLLSLAVAGATCAPSGANQQPWKFVIVTDREIKRRIREAAEEEERKNYSGRMPPEWLEALAPLETDWRKPFLEIAPALIVVFREDYGYRSGQRVPHYYVAESVGIACGFLLAALHQAGLATLTHTPSPMGFLREILERPPNEKPYLLIPVGYPSEGCRVPDIRRKPLEDVLIWR